MTKVRLHRSPLCIYIYVCAIRRAALGRSSTGSLRRKARARSRGQRDSAGDAATRLSDTGAFSYLADTAVTHTCAPAAVGACVRATDTSPTDGPADCACALAVGGSAIGVPPSSTPSLFRVASASLRLSQFAADRHRHPGRVRASVPPGYLPAHGWSRISPAPPRRTVPRSRRVSPLRGTSRTGGSKSANVHVAVSAANDTRTVRYLPTIDDRGESSFRNSAPARWGQARGICSRGWTGHVSGVSPGQFGAKEISPGLGQYLSRYGFRFREEQLLGNPN